MSWLTSLSPPQRGVRFRHQTSEYINTIDEDVKKTTLQPSQSLSTTTINSIMKFSSSHLGFLLFAISILGNTTGKHQFDSREATIESVHHAIFSGKNSCREVVSSFLTRIEAYNPTINALVSLNPDALILADEFDSRIASKNTIGALFCIPILLKDNYDAVGMNTTGGCLDLANNFPSKDAAAVAALKKAGAIVLGKTNLHELALEGLSVSSLVGQTVNPYAHTRTPGGSSGGTGASIATSFAVFGTGKYLKFSTTPCHYSLPLYLVVRNVLG